MTKLGDIVQRLRRRVDHVPRVLTAATDADGDHRALTDSAPAATADPPPPPEVSTGLPPDRPTSRPTAEQPAAPSPAHTLDEIAALAESAQTRGDWQAALMHWQTARVHFPTGVAGYLGEARA